MTSASLEQLQALVDALAATALLCRKVAGIQCAKDQGHDNVSCAASAQTFTYNGNPVGQFEQVTIYKYIGLDFRQSGSIAHLTTPIKPMVGISQASIQCRSLL